VAGGGGGGNSEVQRTKLTCNYGYLLLNDPLTSKIFGFFYELGPLACSSSELTSGPFRYFVGLLGPEVGLSQGLYLRRIA
jgi:hypothetical protein